MKLVIAEKPMLARDIARAMCGVNVSESARLPISGNGYTVIGCVGHLMELAEPGEINPAWKEWDESALPIYIPNWQKSPVGNKKDIVKQIGNLLQECDSVIHAGDPDDEGQLIVDELLDYFGYQGKVERVFVNDNIEKNIRKAFERLIPNEQYRKEGDAAYARQMADKCFGINESRLATMRLHSKVNVGRVQTPTLALVVARDLAIKNHEVQKYFELDAPSVVDGVVEVNFKFKPSETLLGGEKHLFQIDALQAIKARLDHSSAAFETKVTEKVEYAPLPYNLTVLLSDMSRRYGMSAAKTQQVTQDLRDNYKAITYNRSDCQYLKAEHHAQAAAVLTQAMRNIGADWVLDYSLHSKAFNDKNITAHHGIIPQENTVDVSKMTADEKRVYTAIIERYAMQFLPPAVYDVSISKFEIKEGMLTAKFSRLKSAGWKETFGSSAADEEEESQKGWLEAGNHTAAIQKCVITEKETTPPKPYTEGTLITDMASIAKYVTDPEIRNILKAKDDGKKGEHGGIGTTATRSRIIENLKDSGMLESRGGKIRATDAGIKFIAIIPPEIKGADTTARWWLLQQEIVAGNADVNAVQEDVVKVFRQHKDSAYVGQSIRADRPAVGKCPLCGKNVVKTGKIYTCESNKSAKQDDGTWKQVAGCGFKLFGFGGKYLIEKQASSLLSGKAISLKGCTSKAGKKYDCKIRLNNGKVEPIFETRMK